MITEPVSLLGGKSVYCINEEQMRQAERLYKEDSDSSLKIQHCLELVQKSLTRNEQAALAFTLIEQLKNKN